jgi:hypothetical protein
VPYTIWSGEGRQNESPKAVGEKLPRGSQAGRGRRLHQIFAGHHHSDLRRGRGRASGTSKRGKQSSPVPPKIREGTAPCRTPSLPRPAERGKDTSQLLHNTTPPRHHGRPEKCGRATLREAADTIGLLKQGRSVVPRLASPVKHDHNRVHPRVRSCRTTPSSPPHPGIKPTSTHGKDKKPSLAGTAPPPSIGIAGESGGGLGRLARDLSLLL